MALAKTRPLAVEVDAPAVTEAAGQLVQLFGGVRATSSRRRASAAGEQPYRDFLEALGVAVYTTDAAGRITFFNEAAGEFWGRRPALGEEWCGSLPAVLARRPADAPRRMPDGDRAARGPRRPRLQAIAERPDGSRVDFQPYPHAARDTSGRLIGAVNVLVDVTERRRAEDALRATRRGAPTSRTRSRTSSSGSCRTSCGPRSRRSSATRSPAASAASASRTSAAAVDDRATSPRTPSGCSGSSRTCSCSPGSRSDSTPELEPQVLAHVVRQAIDVVRAVDIRTGTGSVAIEPRRRHRRGGSRRISSCCSRTC